MMLQYVICMLIVVVLHVPVKLSVELRPNNWQDGVQRRERCIYDLVIAQ